MDLRELRALADQRGALGVVEARSCHGHLDALGYRVRREGVEALPRAWRRYRRGLQTEVALGGEEASERLPRELASRAGVLLF